jgi:hypothetical protein
MYFERVFNEAAASLPINQQTQECKARFASRILSLAAKGETDPVRLRMAALVRIVSSTSGDARGD